jgi:CRP-like cAMP-binding protein
MEFSHQIRGNRLLEALAPADLALIVPSLKWHPLLQGAVLQESGAPVEQVYFPQSGMISLVAIMQTGEIVETATVGREGVLGAFAGLGNWNAFSRAVVHVPGTAACIAASRFQAAVSQSQRIKDLILRSNEALLSQVQQTAACNALHSLEARLARWLLQALDSCDDATLPLTQDALAQMLGARRTTVTFLARKLQDAGLIRYRRGRIDIVDRVGLEHAACECYETVRRRAHAVVVDSAARVADA